MSGRKKEISLQNMNRWQFLVLWIAAHAFGFGLMHWLGNFLLFSTNWLSPDSGLYWLLGASLEILSGLIYAVPQKWLMKRGLGLDIRWWRRAGAVIPLISGVVANLAFQFFPSLFFSNFPFSPVLLPLLQASPLIFVQILLLRRHLRRAWLWGLASIVNEMILLPFLPAPVNNFIRIPISSLPLREAVTGLTLLWLYGMAQQDEAKYETMQEDAAVERLSNDTGEIEDEHYQLENGTVAASSTSLL